MTDELVSVRLVDFPVALANRVNRHFEAIQREFALIQFADDSTRAAIPQRLQDVAERASAALGAREVIGREQLAEDVAGGAPVVTIEVMLPTSARVSIVALLELLADVDAFCREGELITVAMPAECCAMRDWLLTEMASQIDGAPPVPWSGPPE